MQHATEAIKNNSLPIHAASRQYKISESTLRNRLKQNVFEKHALDPDSQVGFDAENKLARHLKKLQAIVFCTRILAYSLAETLHRKNT